MAGILRRYRLVEDPHSHIEFVTYLGNFPHDRYCKPILLLDRELTADRVNGLN